MPEDVSLPLVALVVACGQGGSGGGGSGAQLKVVGSSTVYPFTTAVAEEFQRATEGRANVTVGVSGTGGGFQKFCAGETDISDAGQKAAKIGGQ